MKCNPITGVFTDSNHVRAGYQRQWKVMGVHTPADPDIQMIESHVSDTDRHFSLAWRVVGKSDDLQYFGATVLFDLVRLHPNDI